MGNGSNGSKSIDATKAAMQQRQPCSKGINGRSEMTAVMAVMLPMAAMVVTAGRGEKAGGEEKAGRTETLGSAGRAAIAVTATGDSDGQQQHSTTTGNGSGDYVKYCDCREVSNSRNVLLEERR